MNNTKLTFWTFLQVDTLPVRRFDLPLHAEASPTAFVGALRVRVTAGLLTGLALLVDLVEVAGHDHWWRRRFVSSGFVRCKIHSGFSG